ncbi:class I SAM-dependent methyltransferase [candidate division WOR-3 bacterium]|nr:class I SAM-dependent methyltransferase [candidate division WOR-3 bacterium]
MGFDSEWWKKFFKGTWQQVQPLCRSPEQTQKEADFIESVLKIQPPAEILDVPCGEGRLTVELASRGYRMSGIDINEVFLEDAREKADKRGLDIAWHQGDMRKVPWEDKFDAAFCMWGSFGYFDGVGDLEFIKVVSCSLKNGGSFLLDIPVVETLFPKYQSKGWSTIGDVIVLEDRCFDHTTGRLEVDWTFIRQKEQETYHSSIRIYTYREVVNQLNQNGFEHFEAFGSLKEEPFEFGSLRLFLVARKSGG